MNQIGEKSSTERMLVDNRLLDLVQLRGSWSWCAKLGIVLIILGILAVSLIGVKNIDPVPLLSWLIVLSGMVEAVHAFHLRSSGGFFFHLIPGIAGIPLGLLMATHPAVGLATWMLVFAFFFTVVSLFRLVSAARLKFPAWRWAVFDSVVMLALGCVFWTTWTWVGLWYFDVAVGVSLVLRGWSSIMLGFALRNWREPIRTQLSPARTAQKRSHTSAQAYRVEATDIS